MIWAPAILMSCAAAEIFAHMPIARAAAQTLGSCAQAHRVIFSPAISDHWKEMVMPAYALRMGRQSLTLASYFIAFVAMAALVMAIMGRVMPETARFMDSAQGLTFGFLVSLVYYRARRRLVPA